MKDIREKPQAQLEFSQVSKTLKNDAMIAELDQFMTEGRMDPTAWFEDNRIMKESVEESPQKDFEAIKETYQMKEAEATKNIDPTKQPKTTAVSGRIFKVVASSSNDEEKRLQKP